VFRERAKGHHSKRHQSNMKDEEKKEERNMEREHSTLVGQREG
jgi:hypothetical protein